jgi:DNA polymerase-3 subunit gamma/tau
MVYYRKYRPQTIAELDLVDVREKLTSILSGKEIPHAFLFTGPRGLGKTSSARILAKAINCPNRGKGKGKREKSQNNELDASPLTLNASIEPCNKCDICTSITEGSNIDIIEIDAASNRGVDEIRSLREKVKFSPSQLSKKVYIIDEVHMLTNEAFNALLKTLEEPPSHVIFILATTEAHKIPQTILSRAFSVKFEKPTLEELSNSLKRIIKGEGLTIDEKIFPKIFELSEGSFRDGAKILEELTLNSKGKKIDLELLEKVYKTGSTTIQSAQLLEALYKKDMNSCLKSISEMANEGIEFKIVIEQLVEKLRKDLIVNSSGLKTSEIKKILELLNEAYASVKFAVVPQLPLELAVVEWSLEDTNQEVDNNSVASSKQKVESRPDNKFQAKISNLSQSSDFLKELIDEVHKKDKRVAAFLRSCRSAEVDKSVLILSTPYAIHAKKLIEPEFRQIILECVFDLDKNVRELQVKTV